ncbi:hypothetical protein [Acinetobacter sp.]|uniref:hypothetical protein n=1 Tax=Acinetobacter sp. TaxID=472 RepID=UPI0035AEAB5E
MKLNTLLTSLVVVFPVSMTSFANESVTDHTAHQAMSVPKTVPTAQFDGQAASDATPSAEEAPTAPSMTVKAATVQSATSLPNVHATQDRENTVFISPRTGMRYSVSNPSNRKIIFQTEGLKPVTAQNVDRIQATNPMISAESQQQAKQKLLDLAGIQPTPVQAPTSPVAPETQTAATPSAPTDAQ